MLNKLIKWIFPIFLFILGFQFTMDHFRLNSKISNLEQLVNRGVKIQTDLNKEYREVTLKIAGIPMRHYDFDYVFNHNNKSYKGTTTFSSIPNSLKTDVVYLPTNPSINNVNPSKELAELESDKNSFVNLLIGTIMLLIGGGLLYSKIKNVMNNSSIKERKNKTQNIKESVISKDLKVSKIDKKNITKQQSKSKKETENSFIKEKRNEKQKTLDNTPIRDKQFISDLKQNKIRDFGVSDHSRFMPKLPLATKENNHSNEEE